MKWSWKLGRFAEIDTYVHASFLLLIGWSAWAAWSSAGTLLSIALGVGFLLAVFGSVLMHELGHALVARRYGITTRRIILSPIGGIAQLEGMPRDPRQELAIALAGPAVNFALAAALWTFGPIFGAGLVGQLLGSVMVANLMLGAFNLLPAFPMDGGRALRAFLTTRVGHRRATQTAVRVGRFIALAMGLIGLLMGQWMLALVAGFVWFAAGAELERTPHDAYRHVWIPPASRRVGRRPRGWWVDDQPSARVEPRRRGWGPEPRGPAPVRLIVVRRWFD